jgi:uncharacterized protein (TIGR03000 family)
MTRLLVVAALLALPAVASAQDSTALPPGYSLAVGPPVLDGYPVIGPAIGNSASALYPVQVPTPPRFSVGGGSMSGYPQIWVPSGSWGGVNYPWPVYPVYVQYDPALVPVPTASGRPLTVSPQLSASNQTRATLVLQFPATAEIWVDGKKGDGERATEWTLTSPAMETGAAHTFEVKGRWKAGGKTFETSRSVTVSAGDRNRLVVISGTEIKE